MCALIPYHQPSASSQQQPPRRCRMHRRFPTRLLTRFAVRLLPGTASELSAACPNFLVVIPGLRCRRSGSSMESPALSPSKWAEPEVTVPAPRLVVSAFNCCGGSRSAASHPCRCSNAVARLRPTTLRCVEDCLGTGVQSVLHRTSKYLTAHAAAVASTSLASMPIRAHTVCASLRGKQGHVGARRDTHAAWVRFLEYYLGCWNGDVLLILDLACEVVLVLLHCCVDRRAQVRLGQLRHLRFLRLVFCVREEGQAQLFRCRRCVPRGACARSLTRQA
jgi:hypothetical protein